MEEVELVFSSLACINGSLLLPDHSGCRLDESEAIFFMAPKEMILRANMYIVRCLYNKHTMYACSIDHEIRLIGLKFFHCTVFRL